MPRDQTTESHRLVLAATAIGLTSCLLLFYFFSVSDYRWYLGFRRLIYLFHFVAAFFFSVFFCVCVRGIRYHRTSHVLKQGTSRPILNRVCQLCPYFRDDSSYRYRGQHHTFPFCSIKFTNEYYFDRYFLSVYPRWVRFPIIGSLEPLLWYRLRMFPSSWKELENIWILIVRWTQTLFIFPVQPFPSEGSRHVSLIPLQPNINTPLCSTIARNP